MSPQNHPTHALGQEGVFQGPVPVAALTTARRMAFIRKVYSLFGMGMLGWIGLTWFIVSNVELLKLAMTPAVMWGSFGVWIASCLGFGFLSRLSEAVSALLYLLLLTAAAAMTGPQVAINAAASGAAVVGQAFLLTVVIFGSLTAYVFMTKSDFSVWGGALVVGTVALFAIGILSIFFPMGGMMKWYSYAVVLLFSGWVLYDTSNILHHYSENMAMTAAVALFIDFVIIFWHLLRILGGRD